MNYSEMIHDFLDSSLPGDQEETLFRALALDEELRFEMKYLVSMREAVRTDTAAHRVPVATTSALFASLGYSAPAVVEPATTVAGGGALAGGASLLPFLGSALAGLLLATALFLTVDVRQMVGLGTNAQSAPVAELQQAAADPMPSSVEEPAQSGRASDLRADEAATTDVSATTGAAVRNSVDPRSAASRGQAPGIRSAAPVRSSSVNSRAALQHRDGGVIHTSPATTSTIDPAEIHDAFEASAATSPALVEPVSLRCALEPDVTVRPTDGSFRKIGADVASLEPVLSEQGDAGGVRIGVRSLVDVPLRQARIGPRPETVALPSDVALSLELPVTDNGRWRLVGEVGREAYLQRFRQQQNGVQIDVEQNPRFLWASGGVRWDTPIGLFGNPVYLQAGAGVPFPTVGWVGRGMMGIDIEAGGGISARLALEGSMLRYQLDNTWFTSPKVAVSYGLNFDLGGITQ